MTGGVNSQHAWPDEGATRVPDLVYQDASDSGNSKCHRARRGRNLAARHSREHPAAADVAALRSARRLAIWRASRVHVGNGAAGLAKPAVLVPAAPGNGAARRGDRYDVRPDARMRAPDRLRLANDLVGWIAGVLSFYNSTFYRHFHAWHHRYTQERDPELMNPKARQPLAILRGDDRHQFLGAPRDRLSISCSRPCPRAALCSGQRTALDSAVDVDAVAGLRGRMGVDRARLRRGSLLLVHAGCAGSAVSAGPADRRAHRVQPESQRADQYAHDLDRVPDPIPDVEHAVPRRAPPLSRGSVSPIARAAPVASGEAGACLRRITGRRTGPSSILCDAG